MGTATTGTEESGRAQLCTHQRRRRRGPRSEHADLRAITGPPVSESWAIQLASPMRTSARRFRTALIAAWNAPSFCQAPMESRTPGYFHREMRHTARQGMILFIA